MKCFGLFCVSIVLLSLSAHADRSESITGSVSIVLTKPLTEMQTKISKEKTRTTFKTELKLWLVENEIVSFDTATALGNFFFNAFYSELITKARESSSYRDKTWTSTITLPIATINQYTTEFNSRYDFKALHAWSQFVAAQKTNDNAVLMKQGLLTIFYASGHIGKPLANPAANEKRSSLIVDARNAYQAILNNLRITYDIPVCKGKCGYLSENVVHINADYQGAPLPGIGIVGRMPYGKTLFSVQTDQNGTCAIEPFRIPYGAMKGTFLTMYPNIGHSIDSSFFFTAEDFSLRLPQAQDLVIIFNTVPSTYVINSYSLIAANGQTIPADFQQKAPLSRFLKDSCFLQPAPSGTPPDLTIDVQWHISQYTDDETELTQLTAEAHISIKDRRLTADPITFTGIVYQKQYDVAIALPWGQYLWESSMALKRTIRAKLFDL